MKYDDFALLCDREWAAGPPFGDVTGLSLTPESAVELAADIADSGRVLDLRPGDAVLPGGCFTGGLRIDRLQNPVTRSDVDITHGAEADTATVSYGNADWSPPPRTVAIG